MRYNTEGPTDIMQYQKLTYTELTNQKIASKVQRKVVSSMTAYTLDAQGSISFRSSNSSVCHCDRVRFGGHSFRLSMIIENYIFGGKSDTNHSFLTKMGCYQASGLAFMT